MAFGCDVFPEKGRCSDASNKHRKRGNPEAFISVFLPGLLEKKYANTLFLEMLTTPQLITCSLLRRQGLRNWVGRQARMGSQRHIQLRGDHRRCALGLELPEEAGTPAGTPCRGDAPASVTQLLHKVPLSLASGLCAQGPDHMLFTASACEPFPSPVGGRVRPGAVVNAPGAERQLCRAGGLAAPSLRRRIGFSWAMGLHTTHSTRELSFANKTKPDLIKIPTGVAQLPARSVLHELLATVPSRAGVGRAEGRLAHADRLCLQLSRWKFSLKLCRSI